MSLFRSATPQWGMGVGAAVVLTMSLAACGSGSSGTAASSTGAGATTKSASSEASGGSSSSSQSGDAPIGQGDIDMGSGSGSTSYPPQMLSQDLAKDCYSGGDRIYDRFGVTCSDAQKVLVTYEASAESASGKEKTVQKYTCSHNPTIMVNQGAAPGKCVDSNGTVVFNWRYPGAPQPQG